MTNVSKKRGKDNSNAKAHKVQIKEDSKDDNIPMDDVTGKPWQLDAVPKRRRVTLNKSRRVVTEIDSHE